MALENTHVGPFFVIKRLGANRRQRVFHARQTEQQRDVAIKFIKFPPKLSRSDVLEKVQIEARELQKVRHPNLVRFYGAGSHENEIFFASELVEGESLASLLTRRVKLSPDLVVEYGRQISEGLNYLHGRNLVHGSLSLEKIMVSPGHKIKISGLRFNQPGRRRWDATRQRELDSAAYLAPEQFTQGATQKSDVYALGVILFEMLTGRLPYELDTMGRLAKKKKTQVAPSVAEEVMNCPVWLDQIVTRMLQPNHKQRPHSAREAAIAFEEIKKIAATGKAAVSQVSGNFNPLTRGVGKAEAKRLLQEKEPQSLTVKGLLQTIPVLLLALATIVGLTVWLLMPPSTDVIVARMREKAASNSPDQWRTASSEMKKLMGSNDPLAKDAEEIYFQARQKMLVDLANRGISNSILQSEETQAFTTAYQMELASETAKAKRTYFRLTQQVDPRGEQRHIFFESKKRFETLSQKVKLPESPKGLMALVLKTNGARSPQELEVAERYLSAIFLKCTGEDDLSEVAARARNQLRRVQKARQILNESAEAKAEEAAGEIATEGTTEGAGPGEEANDPSAKIDPADAE